MKTQFNQRGVSHMLAILAVFVLAAIGIVGYRVVHSNTTPPTTTVVNTAVQPKPVPTKISSKTDVQQAAQALDSTNVDSSLNPDQLGDTSNL